MQIKILQPCFAAQRERKVGDVVEAEHAEALYLVGAKLAEKYDAPPVVPTEEAPASPPTETEKSGKAKAPKGEKKL